MFEQAPSSTPGRRTADSGRDGASTGTGYTALKGVGRAMAVLEAIGERPMRAKELADHLGLKWTTAYRTLAHLEEQEYLRRDPGTGAYSIGARMYLLGSSYLITDPLVAVAPPHLRAVADRMRCGAQANERQGDQVITVAAVDPPTPIRKTTPGFHFPLGIAAKGRVLLAFAPDDVREAVLATPLPAYTQAAMIDPAELREELGRIRETQVAIARDDVQIGVGSVAAPVRDRDGDVAGCLSLVVTSDRLDPDAEAGALAAAVSDAAHDVSVALGWRPTQTLP